MSHRLSEGIYTDVGPKTCAGYEGSYEHDNIDAQVGIRLPAPDVAITFTR